MPIVIDSRRRRLAGIVFTTVLAVSASWGQAQVQTKAQPGTRVLQEIRQLMRQGQSSQALERADTLIAEQPTDARPRFLKGVILTDLNRTNDAVAVYRKLIEDFPELPEPYNNLAVLYAQQREYDKAREALEAAIRANPSHAIAHENLGDLYLRFAGQAYDKALQIEKANTGVQKKLVAVRGLLDTAGTSTAK